VYQRWRHELIERGLEPAPELSDLEQQILEHRVAPSGSALPVPTDIFRGRDRDMAAVATALGESRIVTLYGPGGVGKTRLALEVAAHLGERYGDGVRFCDLSALRRPTDVDRAVATAVGVREQAFQQVVDQITMELASRRLLLSSTTASTSLEPSAASSSESRDTQRASTYWQQAGNGYASAVSTCGRWSP
jgi:hypothetical protein